MNMGKEEKRRLAEAARAEDTATLVAVATGQTEEREEDKAFSTKRKGWLLIGTVAAIGALSVAAVGYSAYKKKKSPQEGDKP